MLDLDYERRDVTPTIGTGQLLFVLPAFNDWAAFSTLLTHLDRLGSAIVVTKDLRS